MNNMVKKRSSIRCGLARPRSLEKEGTVSPLWEFKRVISCPGRPA